MLIINILCRAHLQYLGGITNTHTHKQQQQNSSYHVLSVVESTEMESLVLAVDDDVHHGADLHVDDVVGALATFTQPGLKALQRSGRQH